MNLDIARLKTLSDEDAHATYRKSIIDMYCTINDPASAVAWQWQDLASQTNQEVF